MLNIVIPMAGRGSRFTKEGYEHPKPLIPVHDKRMIEVVINNLKPTCDHRFVFVCQQEHYDNYGLQSVFESSCDNFEVVLINGITEGAAITVLKAREFFENDDALMIANSDQWVDIHIDKYLMDMDTRNLDGGMLTMKANDPKWSYARVNGDTNLVTEVVEKVVISDEATVGIYNFRKGSDFCRLADDMVTNNIRSNGEFYVAPVYSFLANEGGKVGIYNIGEESNGMYGLGIPSDLELFLSLDVSRKACDF